MGEKLNTIPEFLKAGGETGALIRSGDWQHILPGNFSEWPCNLCYSLSLLLNSNTPMFLFWGENNVMFYNDAYIPALQSLSMHPSAMGKTGEEVWGESWKFILPELEATRRGISKVLPDEAVHHLHTSDDILLTYHLNPVKDDKGAVSGILVICNETLSVTAREQLQTRKRLEQLNREIIHLFNSINEGFYSRDIVNQQYIRLSAGCPRIYGYTRDEFFANPGLWADVIHPDDKERVFADDIQLKAGKQTLTEYRIFHKSGNLRWIEVKAIPVLTNGVLTRVDGIVNDITARKQAEQERERMTQDLIEKNVNLKQFSYIVSHNLRSPINKILGLASLIKMAPFDDGQNTKLIEYVVNEATSLDNVVKDLTTIVSFQDLGVSIREDIVIAEEVELVKTSLGQEIEEAGALITCDFTEVNNFKSVKGYFYSILYNLITNAIKYRHPARESKIHISTAYVDNFICLSISDNGLGIDLEKHGSEIFGLYSRFHSKDIPGKGMGLNLVKTQAETLGGKVEVESIPGDGSTFRIYFLTN